MTRMTEKELTALESAKSAPINFNQSTVDSAHRALERAQELRSRFLAEQVSNLWRKLKSALGLNGLAERLAMRRRYRGTVRELSKLDDLELKDLGIGRGGIHAAARKAVGLPESEEPGFFTRLRQRVAEASIRRRTARELSRLDSRMLKDIGLTRDDIHAYLRGEKDLAELHPVMGATAASAGVELFMPEKQNQVGWKGTPQAANGEAEEARAA